MPKTIHSTLFIGMYYSIKVVVLCLSIYLQLLAVKKRAGKSGAFV